MTIKEYILSKPDSYSYEIIYQFVNRCSECHAEFTEVDEEYSSGIGTAAEFREEVSTRSGHYGGYTFIYDEFDIDSLERTAGSEGQELFIITMNSDSSELCPKCAAESEEE